MTGRTPILSLSGILGQERAVETLRSAAASSRVHHAWIFAGPAGVGKFTAAVAFAALLLDPTSAPGLTGAIEPEEGSATQRMIASGSHPDLHVITKELAAYSADAQVRSSKQRNIAKAVIDEHLLTPIALAPSVKTASMAGKVFIVDEAELLDPSLSRAYTQNAMLKTLEEPPAGSVIILVTAHEERLLPTIRSRCQRVAFGRLDAASMQKWLKAAEGELGGLRDADERAWVLAYADGSPGRALTAMRTGLYQWRRTLGPMLAQLERPGAFPLELGPTMAKLIDEWAAARVDEGEKAGASPSKEAANMAAARHMFALLGAHAGEQLRRAPDEPSRARRLRWIDALSECERHVSANVNLQLAMENLAAQWAR
ncbi:MAG: hypothetical protein IBJ11_09770 [Phycisphaerales bacterium]|nr:hypothetical protein [Phycisphaerales bacterium]